MSEGIVASAETQYRRNMVVAFEPKHRRRSAVPARDGLGELIGWRCQEPWIEFSHREQ